MIASPKLSVDLDMCLVVLVLCWLYVYPPGDSYTIVTSAFAFWSIRCIIMIFGVSGFGGSELGGNGFGADGSMFFMSVRVGPGVENG